MRAQVRRAALNIIFHWKRKPSARWSITFWRNPQDQRWMLLAPVVNDRKGEHTQLLDDLRAQGFIRARIDGVVYDLDEAPALDLKKKHTIEVVVDRFKIRDGHCLAVIGII